MEEFTQLFGNLLAFVYHCFDRIVIHGYLSGQIEEYRVELSGATVLELVIVPDISRGSARASLENIRLC